MPGPGEAKAGPEIHTALCSPAPRAQKTGVSLKAGPSPLFKHLFLPLKEEEGSTPGVWQVTGGCGEAGGEGAGARQVRARLSGLVHVDAVLPCVAKSRFHLQAHLSST